MGEGSLRRVLRHYEAHYHVGLRMIILLVVLHPPQPPLGSGAACCILHLVRDTRFGLVDLDADFLELSKPTEGVRD